MLADIDTLIHLDALRRPSAATDLQSASDAEIALALQGGAHRDIALASGTLRATLIEQLDMLKGFDTPALLDRRYARLMSYGL